jgi:hypothetical protein
VAGGASEFVLADGSVGGTTETVNLPASGVAVDDQLVCVALASAAPGGSPAPNPNLQINPGAGNQMWDPTNFGAVLPTGTGATVTTPGAIVGFRYRAAVTAPATAPCWVQTQ